MATLHLQVPEDLVAELEAKAAASGKTVDELAADAPALEKRPGMTCSPTGKSVGGSLTSTRNSRLTSCMNGARNTAHKCFLLPSTRVST
jgi:hypothetical protein